MSGRTRSDVMLEAILNYWDIRRYEVVKADINQLRIELETRLAGIEKKLRLSSWQYRPTGDAVNPSSKVVSRLVSRATW
jgi:hypothetical protein